MSAVAALTLSGALSATAAEPEKARIYRCDVDGKKVTRDRPIAECSNRVQYLLNGDGSILLERVTALGMEKALEVVRAAATRLAPHGKVGTVGYCWGGSVALLSALRLGLPSVSYYGARNVQFLDETPKAPVMFHFGAQDKSIPPEAIQAHREKLPQMATYVYPADHAFNREVGHAYDPDSAALALQRTLDFFSEHLG